MNVKISSRIVLIVLIVLALGVSVAFAGNPHFVGRISIKKSGDTLTISGKEAGLGNETQVHIEVTADAQCVNRGGKHPRAGNKESFSAAGDFPVQNGKANFELTLTATFQPNCSPPMRVVWSNVVITDTTHNISVTYPGPY